MTSISQAVEYDKQVGQGRLSVLFFDVYDIALYSPTGNFSFDAPFSLSLTYLRDIKASDIVTSSIDEITNLGLTNNQLLESWRTKLAEFIPDVVEGDTLRAEVDADKITRFYHNDVPIGTITDATFVPWFFGIWLSENTSKPRLRLQLLGE